MKKLTDQSIMFSGKYKGHQMKNVPSSHLVWLYDNNKCNKKLKKYIIGILDFLRLEAKAYEKYLKEKSC